MNFAAQYGHGQAQIDSEAMVYDPIHVRGPNPSAASRRSLSVRQPVQVCSRRRAAAAARTACHHARPPVPPCPSASTSLADGHDRGLVGGLASCPLRRCPTPTTAARGLPSQPPAVYGEIPRRPKVPLQSPSPRAKTDGDLVSQPVSQYSPLFTFILTHVR